VKKKGVVYKEFPVFTNNDSVANVFLDDLDSVPEEDPGLSSSRFALDVNEDVQNSGLPRLSSSRSIRARNVMILIFVLFS
jgi:hypothetical protein